ncbi:neurochondrin-like isoform X2 [Montipora foliosa]|uniref:neurochondrin-like isoform X2 n=1 Tax=Montipora foliosa TaxID=591990 RepID=UPI0035F14841
MERKASHSVIESDSNLSLQKCILAINSARNDSERFAALLLVTKIVNSNSVESFGRRRLFEAIGFNFINRLLRSRRLPTGCPHDVYRSLAFAILACFATDEEFLLHPDMISKIPLILKAVANKEKIESDSTTADCYQILISLASSSIGCRYLSDKETFSTICQMARDMKCAHSKKAFDIVVCMVNNGTHSARLWEEDREILLDLLETLSKRFKEAEDKSKFEFCNDVVLFLASVEKSSFVETERLQWVDNICIGVAEVLRSKVSSHERDPAIVLVSLLIELVGMNLIIGRIQHGSPDLLILSTTIACIEIRMILDGSTLNNIVPRKAVLVSCYRILEEAINFVVVNSEAFNSSIESPLPKTLSGKLPKVYSLATEAMASIIHFLQSVADNQGEADLQRSQLVSASVRVLCAWMAEETSALQDGISKLLPFLLKLAKESMNIPSEPLSHAKASEKDGSGTSSTNPVSKEEKVSGQGDIMRFLLPPLCHMSADENMRVILIDNNGPELLSRCYFQQWKIWKELEKTGGELAECETCLVTILGIVLNFFVTEAKLVANNVVFQEIGNHVHASVSLLMSSNNDVLLFNTVVLGLLFQKNSLDHGASRKPEEMFQFLSTSVHFLRGTRPFICEKELWIERSLTIQATICQRVSGDVTELWFLCLQIVFDLYNMLPLMRKVVQDSGLLEVMRMHVKTCVQDQNITEEDRNALLDLLVLMLLTRKNQRWKPDIIQGVGG